MFTKTANSPRAAGRVLSDSRKLYHPAAMNLTSLVAAVLVSLSQTVSTATARDLWLGVWVRDAVRSTCNPGPCPQEETSTVTKWEDGITIRLDTLAANGMRRVQVVNLRFDGKPYAAVDPNGSPTGALWAIRHTGGRTFQRVIENGGRVTATQDYVFSDDGNTRITTLVGTAPDGSPSKNVTYWVKR